MNYKYYLFPLVKKWIGGITINDIIKEAEISIHKKMVPVINFLGEEVTDERQANYMTKEYIRLIEIIKKKNINAKISLKLTQLGLSISTSLCEENFFNILEKAKKYGIETWIDMENYKYLNPTINIYLKSLNFYKDLGIALQAYLKNGMEIAKRIIKHEGMIRLVKGAYKESEKVVFKNKKEISLNFKNIMKILFENKTRFVIATHDEKLVYEGVYLSMKYKHYPTFAFLRGIRDDLKKWLIKYNFKVDEYIPYGIEWTGYVYRRIRERKSNILLIIFSLFT